MTVKQLQATAVKMGLDIKKIRAVFEKMHAGRDLSQLKHTAGYLSPQISALWAQHLKTAVFI